MPSGFDTGFDTGFGISVQTVIGYTTRDHRVLYDAIITRLETATTKNVGDHVAPTDLTYPYAVVYHRDETTGEMGTLGDPTVVGVIEWQVTSVGVTADQAQWMSYQSRVALNGWLPDVAGQSFNPVMVDGSNSVQRDDDVQPSLFYAVDRFTVLVN